jgi:hypothetical protein
MVVRQFVFLIAFSSLAAGCASTPPPVGARIARDGLAQDPNRHIRQKPRRAKPSPSLPDPNAEREKVLATLRPYSAEWFALSGQIEAEEDRRLKTRLVICRGCLPQEDADFTGSVRP